MRRVRMFLAAILALTLIPTLAPVPAAHAGGHVGTAMNDFTQVTPANALIYATLQNTNPDQPVNLRRLTQDFKAQPGFAALMRQLLGSMSGSNGNTTAVLNQALALLNHLFNGELGMAVLPISVTTSASGKPSPHLHLLLDAGLRKGITAAQLQGTLGLFGLGGTPAGNYRHLAISRIDIGKFLSMAGNLAAGSGTGGNAGTGSLTIPKNGPISGIFYQAVAGNDDILATDVPTLQQAIDTWFGVAPSVAANADFQGTIGTLPANRFLTLYMHFDVGALTALAHALGAPPKTLAMLSGGGAFSQAYSVAAESDGVLLNYSPEVRTGILTGGAGLSPTQAAEATFLPDDTLLYAAVHDPGTLLRTLLSIAEPALMQGAKLKADPIQAFTKVTGLSLDNDVFSWMHGDASLALLPVGAAAYGVKSPLTRLSLVATMQVSDQGFVEAKIAKINAALRMSLGANGAALGFVNVPGAAGDPLHVLAALPSGIGYTFYHGYLMLGTALPADVAALQRGNAGHNLSMSPLYRAALAHIDNRPYGSVLFINVTHLRQTLEPVVAAMGTNMSSYLKARPLLTAIKSLAVVNYAGPAAGGAVFVGIGR